MSNPKVFEFAKEIGMTPLALMDKIREWQLPVKSHMAELDPELMATLKNKLSGAGAASAEEAKPKKAVARKATAPKAAAPKTAIAKPSTNKPVTVKKAEVEAAAPAPATTAKTPVIRRKTKEIEEAAQAAEAEESAAAVEAAPAVEAPKVKVVSRPAAAKTEEIQVVPPAVEVTKTAAPVVAAAAPAAEVAPTKVATLEAATPTPVATPIAVAPVPAGPAPIARKKEVVVGTSGIASSSTVASAPKRNIIGRMDLSRVQPPPGSQRPAGGGYSADRAQQGASSTGYRPGGGTGFNRPAGGTVPGGRNLRTGFVAASNPQEPIVIPENFDSSKDRDADKKAKKLSGAGPTGKEKEGVVVTFNAVEFRKRELVFQPKKKKDILARTALKTNITKAAAHKRVLKVNGKMKVSDVAQEMGLKAPQLMKVLMQNGVMANLNMLLDFDTIALILPEFGWEAENTFQTADEVLSEMSFGNKDAAMITRPPVVTVMGHVDHGKTSLLDAIRNANVVKGEAGGITQHIGAYSVKLEDGYPITFLDTPGHEAFTAMRARGANATDIAIIVVAADDGMMPQTQEAVNHAKAAGVPIIVAVNKIDKPGANPEKIKQQLTELEIVPEEWGGTTMFVEVSALKRTGLDKLLENIRLLAEVGDFKANPEMSGSGIVIEAKIAQGRGPVATLLVKDGTVKVGQYIVAGEVKGRVRSLTNDKGERVDSMGPGFPVEILGLEAAPKAGDKFDIVKDEGTAEKAVELRQEQAVKAAHTPVNKLSLEEIFARVKTGDVKELAIILKADVQGSLEALNGMISKISTSEVKAKVIHSAVGGINESDVLLARTSKGIVIGFGVRPDNGAQQKAKQTGVDIRTYSIVYELIDDLKKAMGGLLAPTIVEEIMGQAEVRNIFTVPKIGTIAGCFVTSGKVQRNNMIRLVRDGKIVLEGKISSLKRFKDDAKEVATGFECGIGIENFNDVKVGDVMEAFVKKEVVRELEANS